MSDIPYTGRDVKLMIKALQGDRWGKQEATEQGSKRQLMWEEEEKVTEKEKEKTKDKIK